MKKANDIKQLRKILKEEIISLMEKGHKITEHIKFLKWSSADACDTYNRYRVNMKPETDEQRELAIAAADIFRPIRKACLRPNTAKKRIAMWKKKKQFGIKARHLQLLYGMLNGKTYNEMEPTTNSDPDIEMMVDIINKHVEPGELNNKLVTQVCGWINYWNPLAVLYPEGLVPPGIIDTDYSPKPVFCTISKPNDLPLENMPYTNTIDIVLC